MGEMPPFSKELSIVNTHIGHQCKVPLTCREEGGTLKNQPS